MRSGNQCVQEINAIRKSIAAIEDLAPCWPILLSPLQPRRSSTIRGFKNRHHAHDYFGFMHRHGLTGIGYDSSEINTLRLNYLTDDRIRPVIHHDADSSKSHRRTLASIISQV